MLTPTTCLSTHGPTLVVNQWGAPVQKQMLDYLKRRAFSPDGKEEVKMLEDGIRKVQVVASESTKSRGSKDSDLSSVDAQVTVQVAMPYHQQIQQLQPGVKAQAHLPAHTHASAATGLLPSSSPCPSPSPASTSSSMSSSASLASGSSSCQRYRMSDFKLGRVIGTGTFGRVCLATLLRDGKTYAIKSISKAASIKDHQVQHLEDERALLSSVDHTFIIRLRGTFQDAACVYLVMDYVPGGEFFTLLRDKGRLTEEKARFYAAQIILALEYLHSQNIAYRDLKPENLLLGGDGYIRVADFGFAKKVYNKTYTVCGTPDYLAPEVILAQGHSKACDWWSLGCVIYEMLYGFPPFYTVGPDGRSDPQGVYRKVLGGQLAFPSFFSTEVRDLLSRLLQPNPSRRIGSSALGPAELRKHPWFEGLDFNIVAARRYQPPYVPSLRSSDDDSNFDDYSSLPPLRHAFEITPEQDRLFANF